MTAEKLALLGGAVLSLLFSYVPGLNGWFQMRDAITKRLVMAFLLLVVAGGALVLSCTSAGEALVLSCTSAGEVDLIGVYLLALVANQSVYAISPTPSSRNA